MAIEKKKKIERNSQAFAESFNIQVEGAFTFQRTGTRSIAFRNKASIGFRLQIYRSNRICEFCRHAVCEFCGKTLHYLKQSKRHYCPSCRIDLWHDVQGRCVWFDESFTDEFKDDLKADPCKYGFRSKHGKHKRIC